MLVFSRGTWILPTGKWSWQQWSNELLIMLLFKPANVSLKLFFFLSVFTWLLLLKTSNLLWWLFSFSLLCTISLYKFFNIWQISALSTAGGMHQKSQLDTSEFKVGWRTVGEGKSCSMGDQTSIINITFIFCRPELMSI